MIKHYTDIDYAVMATAENEGYHIDFKVYSILGYVDGDKSKPLYELKDSTSHEHCETFEEAAVFLSGSIKWDGCSDMNFDEQENCMLHFCSRKDAADIGILMSHLYDLAIEMMPEHASDID